MKAEAVLMFLVGIGFFVSVLTTSPKPGLVLPILWEHFIMMVFSFAAGYIFQFGKE